MNKMKEHIKRNKKFYIGVVVGLGLTGITYAIMKGKTTGLPSGSVAGSKIGLALQADPETSFAGSVLPSNGDAHPTFLFSNSNIVGGINLTNNLYSGNRGHPGFITRCIDTNTIFSTQADAASYFGINPKTLSEHLRGFHTDANGLHFERISVN